MNNRQIEESIKQSIALDTPDLFDKIVSAPVQKLPEEDYIVKERPKRNVSKLQLLYTACTSLAIVFLICFGLIHNYYSVDSIVAIDVNPSVEIALNKSYKVLSVRANNEDAASLIKDKIFKNRNCDDVIFELTMSLSSSGYINKNKNSILVSVSNSNEVKADEVKTRVVTDIKTTLNEQKIEPVIYKQSISNSKTKELERLAKQYHTSFGKMQLINSLIKKDETLTIEELVALPIQEIKTYVEKRQIKMADVIECEDETTTVASNQTENKKSKPLKSTKSSTNENSLVDTTEESGTQTTITSTSITTSTDTSSATENIPSSLIEGSTATSKYCPYCWESCTCENCKADLGCKKDCPNCSADCPNYKPNNTTETTTGESSNKPNKDSNKDSNKNSNQETTEPDDIGTSGNTEAPEDVVIPPASSTDEEEDMTTSGTTDEEEDMTTSGTMDEPDENTTSSGTMDKPLEDNPSSDATNKPEESNPSSSTTTNPEEDTTSTESELGIEASTVKAIRK